jgi:hypothetical protein
MALNRITPLLRVQDYTTYGFHNPTATHTRAATCEEVECEQWKYGWVTRLPLNSDLAVYIASGNHGRVFRETTGPNTAEREFIFPPGQKCFRSTQHRVKLDRPPIYTVRGGDWRAAISRPRVVNGRDWLESFGLNQQAVADRQRKG